MSTLVARLKNTFPLKRSSKLKRMDGFQLFLLIMLTVLSVFMLLPIVYIFSTAFKPYQELFLYPPTFLVRNPTIQNFVDLLNATQSTVIPVTRYIFNSVIVTFLAVFGMTIIGALAAYPLSKHEFPGRGFVFASIVTSLMFVPEAVGIPRYVVVSHLGIMNTYMGHVFPLLANSAGVFLIKQFVDGVPNELMEASKIDGASEITIFLRIVIPLAMPAVATMSIIAFQAAWSNTETSNLYMQDESMKTMPFYLSTITSGLANSVARQGAAAAGGLLMFVPNLIIFLFQQRRMIATMAHSGIK
ncbi:MAG: transporter permease [Bacilli bacterium]|nr:transporter permease [Bacilli bacterium]